jgi:hypothetical protein
MSLPDSHAKWTKLLSGFEPRYVVYCLVCDNANVTPDRDQVNPLAGMICGCTCRSVSPFWNKHDVYTSMASPAQLLIEILKRQEPSEIYRACAPRVRDVIRDNGIIHDTKQPILSTTMRCLFQSPFGNNSCSTRHKGNHNHNTRIRGEFRLADSTLITEMPTFIYDTICTMHTKEQLRTPDLAVDFGRYASTLDPPGIEDPIKDSLLSGVVKELELVRLLLRKVDQRRTSYSVWHRCWSRTSRRVTLKRLEEVWKAMPRVVRDQLLRRKFTFVLRGTNAAHLSYLLFDVLARPCNYVDIAKHYPFHEYAGAHLPIDALLDLLDDSVEVLDNYAQLVLCAKRLMIRIAVERPDITGDSGTLDALLARILLSWTFYRKVVLDCLNVALEDFCLWLDNRAAVAEATASSPPAPNFTLESLDGILKMIESASPIWCLVCRTQRCSSVMRPCGDVYACIDCASKEKCCLMCKCEVDHHDQIKLWSTAD